MSLLKTDFFGVAVSSFFAARFSFDKIINRLSGLLGLFFFFLRRFFRGEPFLDVGREFLQKSHDMHTDETK